MSLPTGGLAGLSSQRWTVRRSWKKATIPGSSGSQKAIRR